MSSGGEGWILMKSFKDFAIWKDVDNKQWENWKWQISHCINSLEDLAQVVNLLSLNLAGALLGENSTQIKKMNRICGRRFF